MEILKSTLLCFLCITVASADPAAYECPTGWEDNGIFCYNFNQDEVNLPEAKRACQALGDKVFVLTINSDMEHSFIYNTLNEKYDPGTRKRDWWTSGRRVSDKEVEYLQFYWEGDGRPIESIYYWHDERIVSNVTLNKIIYNYDGAEWGWSLTTSEKRNPFVCKISKEDIYHITDIRRGLDYGYTGDPKNMPRAPKMLEEPRDVLFEMSVLVLPDDVRKDYVTFTCRSDAVPSATYNWYKLKSSKEEKIDPSKDTRYTLVGGSLVIDDPKSETDVGFYWCKAVNELGTTVSERAQLEFGYIGDFSRDKRSPVVAQMHKEAIIDCSPPKINPKNSAVTYEWYKGTSEGKYLDYVRTDVKSYIFISWDGRLYFSEVSDEDIGYYFCKVSRPGISTSSGAFSPSIPLDVKEASPGDFDPTIMSGFPVYYPKEPKVGDEVRLECFAAGSSDPPMSYTWTKLLRKANGMKEEVSLPKTVLLEDHNRVMIIKKVEIYDAGIYRCTATRFNGKSDAKEVQLNLIAKPFFVVRLNDQMIDVGSEFRWRCSADGEPVPEYRWLKDGEYIHNGTLGIEVFHGTLTLKMADPKQHNGTYQCEAVSSNGRSYSTAELRVIEFAPTFKKQPLQVNQFATAKGNSTIICRPEGAPRPEVTWYKDGSALASSERVRIMPNGNLFLSDILASDSGMYKCVAVNTLGEAESEGEFTVLDTVTITQKPQTPLEGFRLNHTNILHCIASYNPQLDITYVWYQGDMMIEFEKVYRLGENRYHVWHDPHFKRGSGHYVGALYFMNAQYSHNGKYTCVVEDTNGGKMSASIDVVVLGPPYEPAGVLVKENSATNTSCEIQFIPAGNNGGPITSFVLESFNNWEGFWRIHETNIPAPASDEEKGVNIQEHAVTGLRPNTTYQFRIRAENRYGTSDPSVPSGKVMTSSVKPDKYPDQVGGGGGKVGELVIRWKRMPRWEYNGGGFHYIVYFKFPGSEEFVCDLVNEDGCKRISHTENHASIVVGKDNPFKPYDIAVRAVNNMGEGPLSPTVTIRSAMGMPEAQVSDVKIQPMNSTACIVSWIPEAEDAPKLHGRLGGYRVAYWEVEKYGMGVREDAPRITINGQASEALVIGMLPNTQYMFGVYVWTEAGNAPIADPYPQRTLRQAPINQPVEVKVFRLSDSSIRVTYRGISTTNQEEPLIGYKIRLWHGGTNIKRADDYDAKKEVDFKIHGLNPEIHYKLRVFGWSRGGDGTMSSPAVEFKLGTAAYIRASGVLVFLMALLTLLKNNQ